MRTTSERRRRGRTLRHRYKQIMKRGAVVETNKMMRNNMESKIKIIWVGKDFIELTDFKSNKIINTSCNNNWVSIKIV